MDRDYGQDKGTTNDPKTPLLHVFCELPVCQRYVVCYRTDSVSALPGEVALKHQQEGSYPARIHIPDDSLF